MRVLGSLGHLHPSHTPDSLPLLWQLRVRQQQRQRRRQQRRQRRRQELLVSSPLSGTSCCCLWGHALAPGLHGFTASPTSPCPISWGALPGPDPCRVSSGCLLELRARQSHCAAPESFAGGRQEGVKPLPRLQRGLTPLGAGSSSLLGELGLGVEKPGLQNTAFLAARHGAVCPHQSWFLCKRCGFAVPGSDTVSGQAVSVMSLSVMSFTIYERRDTPDDAELMSTAPIIGCFVGETE